jgi:hypothetical protein
VVGIAGGTPAFPAQRVLGARASRSHGSRNALLGNAASKHARKKPYPFKLLQVPPASRGEPSGVGKVPPASRGEPSGVGKVPPASRGEPSGVGKVPPASRGEASGVGKVPPASRGEPSGVGKVPPASRGEPSGVGKVPPASRGEPSGVGKVPPASRGEPSVARGVWFPLLAGGTLRRGFSNVRNSREVWFGNSYTVCLVGWYTHSQCVARLIACKCTCLSARSAPARRD